MTRIAHSLATLSVLLLAAECQAQKLPIKMQGKRVSFSAKSTAGQTVTFTHVPATEGQRVDQSTKTKSSLQTTYQQSGQVISSDSKNETIKQRRIVTVLETVAQSGTAAVQVKYEAATKKTHGRLLLATSKPQPVAGKAYVVRRVAEELVVSYPDGSAPPPAELGIVKVTMQSVGKKNPLANFLNGRTVRLGEVLTLPKEVGDELIGAWLGKDALPVTVKMVKVQNLTTATGSVPAATFEIQMGCQDADGEPTVSSSGQITVGILNCRTLNLKMAANVDLTEQRGPDGASFTVANVGDVEMEMSASYR